jgi:hypothetical protein
MVLVNITRNRLKNQWGQALARGSAVADVCGADSHGGHVQHVQLGYLGLYGLKLAFGPR